MERTPECYFVVAIVESKEGDNYGTNIKMLLLASNFSFQISEIAIFCPI